jgi:hypothetical protein
MPPPSSLSRRSISNDDGENLFLAKAMTLAHALTTHGRVPKCATSDGDKAKGPEVVFEAMPWQ